MKREGAKKIKNKTKERIKFEFQIKRQRLRPDKPKGRASTREGVGQKSDAGITRRERDGNRPCSGHGKKEGERKAII